MRRLLASSLSLCLLAASVPAAAAQTIRVSLRAPSASVSAPAVRASLTPSPFSLHSAVAAHAPASVSGASALAALAAPAVSAAPAAAAPAASPAAVLAAAGQGLREHRAPAESVLDEIYVGREAERRSDVLASASETKAPALAPAPAPASAPAREPKLWKGEVLPEPSANRLYWRHVSLQVIINAALAMLSTALPKIIGEGAEKSGERGINRSVGWGAQAAASLTTGPMADRKPAHKVLAVSYASAGAALLLVPVLFLSGWWGFGVFTAVWALANFAFAAAQNSNAVVYNSIVGPHVAYYNRANAVMTVAIALVGVAAPLTTAAALAGLGPATAAALNWGGGLLGLAPLAVDPAGLGHVMAAAVMSAALFIAALGYWRWPAQAARAATAAAGSAWSYVKETWQGLRLAFGHAELRRMLLLSVVRIAALDAIIFALLPTFLPTLSGGAGGFAIAMAAGNLGTGLAASWLAVSQARKPGEDEGARLRAQGRRWTWVRGASWLLLAGLFATGSIWAAAAVIVAATALQVPANIVWGSLTTKLVGDSLAAHQGKVYAAMALFNIVVTMAGGLALGPLIQPLEFATRIWIAVGFLAAAALFDFALARWGLPAAAPAPAAARPPASA